MDVSSLSSAEKLCLGLNNFFNGYSKDHEDECSSSGLPLYMFDSSLFEEKRAKRIKKLLPTLLPHSEEEELLIEVAYLMDSSSSASSIGVWSVGHVTKRLADGTFLLRGKEGDNPAPAIYIVFADSCETEFSLACARIKEALHRRRTSLRLLRYHFQLKCIPFDLSIASSLGSLPALYLFSTFFPFYLSSSYLTLSLSS